MVYEYWLGGYGAGHSDHLDAVYEAASSGSTTTLVIRMPNFMI